MTFDLYHIADEQNPAGHGLLQPTDLVIPGQSSTMVSTDVRDVHEHQYEACLAASDSGAKLTKRGKRRGPRTLSIAVDTPLAPPP